ncbi:MAG: prepilin-type N-terminal cleavage/methylation domain-containing protein [bacterium]
MQKKINRRGFTLIELLVVIAIIAILAAILFPVFARAREKARQTTCTSNQRQIAASVQMYIQDHEETFPSTTTMWQDIKVDPGVLICPTLGKATPLGYSYSNLVGGAAVGTLNDPALVLLTADAILHAATTASGVVLATAAGPVIYTTADLDLRHTNSAIASFVDGHVAMLTSPPLLSGLPMTDTVMLGTCPYTLAAQDGGAYGGSYTTDCFCVNSSPGSYTATWSSQPVGAVMIDEVNSDSVQSGTIAVGGRVVANYATTVANSTGVIINLFSGIRPSNSTGGTIVANGTNPPMLRSWWRLNSAQWLCDNPGTNIARTASTISNSTSSGASKVIDGSITAADRWRADSAATANYVGITFTTPTKVKGMRVTSGESNGTSYRWSNYHVQLQYSTGGTWDDVGTANQNAKDYYWCYLANRAITGVRLYGDNTLGNNPTTNSGLIIDEIQLYAP